MHERRRPGRGKTRQPHALLERGCHRAPTDVSAMLLVADERRVADHGVLPSHPVPEMRWRGQLKEVRTHEIRTGTSSLQQRPRSVERRLVEVNSG